MNTEADGLEDWLERLRTHYTDPMIAEPTDEAHKQVGEAEPDSSASRSTKPTL